MRLHSGRWENDTWLEAIGSWLVEHPPVVALLALGLTLLVVLALR